MKKLSTDLCGMKFGKLTVILRSGLDKSGKNSTWKCVCQCGKEIIVTRCNLTQFHTQSCGCIISQPEEQYLIDQQKRFLKFVDKTDSCWIWKGSKDKEGYGCFNYRCKKIKAHRYSYSLIHGIIKGGYFICHKCDNPSCVNPDHLYEGTCKDNMKDIRDRKRWGNPRKRIEDKQKNACKILHKNNFSYREISELLNISIGTVKKYAK